MTKQDYILLANIIRDDTRLAPYGKVILKDSFVISLIVILKSDNPRFDEETFRKACEY